MTALPPPENPPQRLGAALSRASSGDVAIFIDSFRINAQPVAQEEFELVFGRCDEKVWLTAYTLTDESINDVVFGW